MKKILIIVFLVLFYHIGYSNDFNEFYLKAEKASNSFYPGLKSYKCNVKTSQFDIIMNKMTASMPKDMPRPERPQLRKYWHHKKGMVVVLEGRNVFPYMQELSKKMISQFALELNGFFFPMDKKKERDLMLSSAIKKAELMGNKALLTIEFNNPIFLDNIFYKSGLPLPVDEVKLISFTVDKESGLIDKMNIVAGKDKSVTYEVIANYDKKNDQYLLSLLKLSTSDNSIKAEFKTEFIRVDGYYLPANQTRVLEGKDIPEEQRKIVVEFTDYLLNKKIPDKVFKQ